jgi:hypothetical protein
MGKVTGKDQYRDEADLDDSQSQRRSGGGR